MGSAKHRNEIRLNTGDGPGASRLEDFTNLGAVFLGNHVKMELRRIPMKCHLKEMCTKLCGNGTRRGPKAPVPGVDGGVCVPLLVNVPGLGMDGKFALRVGFHPVPR